LVLLKGIRRGAKLLLDVAAFFLNLPLPSRLGAQLCRLGIVWKFLQAHIGQLQRAIKLLGAHCLQDIPQPLVQELLTFLPLEAFPSRSPQRFNFQIHRIQRVGFLQQIQCSRKVFPR
jgi:hypothetical protein